MIGPYKKIKSRLSKSGSIILGSLDNLFSGSFHQTDAYGFSWILSVFWIWTGSVLLKELDFFGFLSSTGFGFVFQ